MMRASSRWLRSPPGLGLVLAVSVAGKKCMSQAGAGTVSIGRLFVKTAK